MKNFNVVKGQKLKIIYPSCHTAVDLLCVKVVMINGFHYPTLWRHLLNKWTLSALSIPHQRYPQMGLQWPYVLTYLLYLPTYLLYLPTYYTYLPTYLSTYHTYPPTYHTYLPYLPTMPTIPTISTYLTYLHTIPTYLPDILTYLTYLPNLNVYLSNNENEVVQTTLSY